MSTLARAIAIAAEAHADHVDKAGAPYILHSLRVTTLDEDWNCLPDLRQRNRNPFAAPPRPACLAELGRVAKLLGTAYESFVRVDLYATAKGPVFGEFAATPFRGQGFSAWADRDLGALWELTFPNRI